MSAPAPAPAPAAAPAAGEPKPDYLDKGLAALPTQYGGKHLKDAKTREKVGDFIRKIVEKVTGKKVPANVSN